MKFGRVAVMKLNKDILITVVIPCYNSGRTIEKAIQSIFVQTWKKIELIIVDDGSDEIYTKNILKKLSNCKVISQTNKGLPSARNFGVKQAKGDFVFFLDADDRIERKTLEELLFILKCNSSNYFSFPHMQLEGDLSKKIENRYNLFEQLFLNKIPYSIMINKKIFLEMNGYCEKLINGYEDWEFNIRLGSKNIFGLPCPNAILYYNVSNSGMLKSKSLKVHGFIWKVIQNENKSSYNLINLFSSYKQSKRNLSVNPLEFYFIYYLIWKVIPIRLFNLMFRIIIKIKDNN